MVSCPKCGAICRDKNEEKRFLRRHPVKCQAHERFQHDLAADTKSVDYDEQEQKDLFTSP